MESWINPMLGAYFLRCLTVELWRNMFLLPWVTLDNLFFPPAAYFPCFLLVDSGARMSLRSKLCRSWVKAWEVLFRAESMSQNLVTHVNDHESFLASWNLLESRVLACLCLWSELYKTLRKGKLTGLKHPEGEASLQVCVCDGSQQPQINRAPRKYKFS